MQENLKGPGRARPIHREEPPAKGQKSIARKRLREVRVVQREKNIIVHINFVACALVRIEDGGRNHGHDALQGTGLCIAILRECVDRNTANGASAVQISEEKSGLKQGFCKFIDIDFFGIHSIILQALGSIHVGEEALHAGMSPKSASGRNWHRMVGRHVQCVPNNGDRPHKR